jgi:trehalose 6-phosphate phosphatase
VTQRYMAESPGSPADLDALVAERVLPALAERPSGLLTDVDGTISAIAPSPDAATLLPGVAELLRSAIACFDVVAAISGRSAEDARRLVGVDGLLYLGNHGLEWIDAGADGDEVLHVLAEAEPYTEAIAAALDDVEATLAPRWPGILVERKGVTGSVHVRATSDPPAAMDAVARLLAPVATRHGLRITTGKLVVEVRPPVEADKGTAVTALVRNRGLRLALYLGDDRTDLDAFRALRRLADEGVCRAVTVAVLSPEAPPELGDAADLTLPSVEAVPAFLRAILAACQ